MDYEFIPEEGLKENQINQINDQILKSKFLVKENLDRILSYLTKEKQLGNYIEIDIPLFDSNLSLKINLFYEKILIGVMNYKDSEFFGSLILEGYECLNNKEIKKIGTLPNSIHNFKRYDFQ